MWGEKVTEDEIDFEWPTQSMLDDMEPDVTLRSLELRANKQYYELSYVRCELSNKVKSPIFEGVGDAEHGKARKVISFSRLPKVRSVTAMDGWNSVCRLRFFDDAGNQVD